MAGAIALIVTLAKTYLWVLAILLCVYLLALGHAWVSAWRKPVRYEVPPGFYRVNGDDHPPEGYVTLHEDHYEALLADRDRLRRLREDVDRVDRLRREVEGGRMLPGARPRSTAAHVGDCGAGEDWSYER